jgi:hypothetical protein
LKEERQVSFLEASRFAQEEDVLFLETSALTGENVNVRVKQRLEQQFAVSRTIVVYFKPRR